jgi:hypothetical protein
LNGGLDDRDDEVRIACLKSIAKLGPVGQGIGNRLVDLMRSDKNPKVRLAAANAVSAVYALSRFHKGIAAHIPTIESVVFEDEDREVRKAAIWALRAVAADSPSAVPTYVRILKSKQDSDSREIVMLGIVDIGPYGKDAVPQLLALLRDATEPSLLRGLAASALGNIGYNADEVVPVFLMLLEDAKQNELHGAILVGIENYGPKATDAASAIRRVLKQTKGKNGQPQIDLRSQAVRALGAVMPDDPETRKVLERMVNDESEPIPVRIAAANALKMVGKRGHPGIVVETLPWGARLHSPVLDLQPGHAAEVTQVARQHCQILSERDGGQTQIHRADAQILGEQAVVGHAACGIE